METTKEEINYVKKEEQWTKKKTYVACLWSFLVSMAGGLLLCWWDYEYHPTNRQLWMVPLGLILFVTPVITWFSVFVSYICNSKEENQLTGSSHDSVHNPER